MIITITEAVGALTTVRKYEDVNPEDVVNAEYRLRIGMAVDSCMQSTSSVLDELSIQAQAAIEEAKSTLVVGVQMGQGSTPTPEKHEHNRVSPREWGNRAKSVVLMSLLTNAGKFDRSHTDKFGSMATYQFPEMRGEDLEALVDSYFEDTKALDAATVSYAMAFFKSSSTYIMGEGDQRKWGLPVMDEKELHNFVVKLMGLDA